MTGKNRTLAYCLFMMGLLLSLSACGSGSSSPEETNTPATSGDTGTISFTINWEDEPQASQTAGTREQASETVIKGAVDCLGRNLATIEVFLFDSNGQQIIFRQWPCDNHGGTIEEIPAPLEGVTILFMAKDNDGYVAYRGEKGGLTINKGPQNDVGPIDAFRFIPGTPVLGDQADSVKWNSIPGAAKYRVVFSTTADFSTPAAHEGVTEELSYTPSGLTPGTQYHVKIFALDGRDNEGAGSAPGPLTTLALEAVPQNVTATGDLKKITVNWEGGQETRYNIYWSTTPNVAATHATNGGKIENHVGTSFDHADLQGNTAYYYVVTSVNAAGYESDISAEVTATAVGDPSGPENVTATAGDRNVTLNWTAVPGFVYTIYWATEPGVTTTGSQKLAENLDAATYVHENCDSNTTYYYIVTAKNDLGESTPQGEVSAAPGWITPLPGKPAAYNAVDASGNLFKVSNTPDPLENQQNIGEEDILLYKLDRHGDLQWAKLFGSPDYDYVQAVGTDAAGNAYVTGLTKGDWHEGHVNPLCLIFLLKVDPDGNQEWVQFLPIVLRDANGEVAIAVDPDGNSFIAGSTQNSWGTAEDAFIAKYDTNGGIEGQPNWIQYLISDEKDESWAVALDGQGHVYVTGSTEGDLGGQTNVRVEHEDIFVAKYTTADGTRQWVTLMGTQWDDVGQAIAVHQNDCYISGYWYGDLLVAKLNASDGVLQWDKQIKEAKQNSGFGKSIALTPNGNLLVGTYIKSAGFGGQNNSGEPIGEEPADGEPDDREYPAEPLLMAFDSAGNPLWSDLFGTPADDYITWISTDANGYVYMTGNSFGDFGGYPNSGGRDTFAWKRYIGP